MGDALSESLQIKNYYLIGVQASNLGNCYANLYTTISFSSRKK